MKIINDTLWNTAHLKAILQKAAEIELEPAKRKVLVVRVVYTRGGHSSGCAYVGGRHATVRIRHPFSRASRYLHVPHDDPRTATGFWNDGKGNEGKVVRDASAQALVEKDHRELVLHVASVACHEFAHIRGMQHGNMPSYYKWSGKWRPYVQWAEAMPLEVKPQKVSAKPTAEDKLGHARKMLKAAESRVKRATTILRKWKLKEKYYERAMAAQGAKS